MSSKNFNNKSKEYDPVIELDQKGFEIQIKRITKSGAMIVVNFGQMIAG